MRLFFPIPEKSYGFTYGTSLRILNKLELEKPEVLPNEVIVSKNYRTGETILGTPHLRKIKFEGRLYEKLVNLKISRDPSRDLTDEDKQKIINFVEQFGSLYLSPQNFSAQMRGNHNLSYFEGGDEVNWVFFPYTSKPQDTSKVGYFESFQHMLNNFLDAYEIIKNDGLFSGGGIQTVFNNALERNSLYLNPNDRGNHILTWKSSTCLDFCYLELYGLLLSKQEIKTCKYCGNEFESSKSNEVRCQDCRQSDVYRKLYHQRNLEVERKKARIRMRRLRLKKLDVA